MKFAKTVAIICTALVGVGLGATGALPVDRSDNSVTTALVYAPNGVDNTEWGVIADGVDNTEWGSTKPTP